MGSSDPIIDFSRKARIIMTYTTNKVCKTTFTIVETDIYSLLASRVDNGKLFTITMRINDIAGLMAKTTSISNMGMDDFKLYAETISELSKEED